MRLRVFVSALIIAALAVGPATFACGTCGCSLNSDWISQGYSFGSGFNLNLRFDYFDQGQLRTGTGTVDKASIVYPADQEIQLSTINRNYMFEMGYSPSDAWSVNLIVPIADRTHSTIAEGDLAPSYSRSAGLGDVRLLGRYQGFSADHSVGIQFGLKLPTGRIDDRFISGPQAGEIVDRGLQLGSGTTDLLVGAYKFGNFTRQWGYFASALAQLPLDSKDEFSPGESLTLSGGVRYTGFRSIIPQLQLNWRAEKPETGANADTANSGATIAYLSPGFTASLGHRLQAFLFLQLPVYQRVTGYQLEPHYLLTVGLNYSF